MDLKEKLFESESTRKKVGILKIILYNYTLTNAYLEIFVSGMNLKNIYSTFLFRIFSRCNMLFFMRANLFTQNSNCSLLRQGHEQANYYS